jgi:hypothetical protein
MNWPWIGLEGQKSRGRIGSCPQTKATTHKKEFRACNWIRLRDTVSPPVSTLKVEGKTQGLSVRPTRKPKTLSRV